MARLVNIHSAVCKHEITKDGLKKKVPRERVVSMHLFMVHTACALKCYYVLFVIKRTHKCDDVYHISTHEMFLKVLKPLLPQTVEQKYTHPHCLTAGPVPQHH